MENMRVSSVLIFFLFQLEIIEERSEEDSCHGKKEQEQTTTL
jgi:hypothetical protein